MEVEFPHLKAPAAQAGPWKMAMDPATGDVQLDGPAYDVVALVRWAGARGLTADVAACHLFAVESPNSNQVKKAVYRLNKKVADGILYRRDGERGGGPDRQKTTWFLAAYTPEAIRKPDAGEQSEKQSEPIRKPAASRQSESGGDTSPPLSDCCPGDDKDVTP